MEFDPSIPSIARVYDYILGGESNFAVDRELADRMLDLVPAIAELVVENRRFLSRAVSWAASQGIGQFIDLGCGLPTSPNTHESAQAILGDARVVYVDNDPVVVNHVQMLLGKAGPGVRFLDSDIRDVASVLDGARASLDLSAPVCLIAASLLHFFTADAARELMARYTAALAPSSCLVLSLLQATGEASEEGLNIYSSAAVPLYSHPVPEITSFFGPLELVPPGLAVAQRWHPRQDLPDSPPPTDFMLVGVARKQPF